MNQDENQDEVDSQIVRYVRQLTRGVSRHHKNTYLLQRWCEATQRGNRFEASIIYAFLSTLVTLERRARVPFNFNAYSSDQCLARFRFTKAQLEQLVVLLGMPQIITREGTTATPIEGLCTVLYKLAVPIRWLDLIDEFGRSSCGLSNIFLHVMKFLDCKYDRLLQFNQEYAAQHLAGYANAIFDAGGHLTNVWSFIDGTIRGVCRPQPRNRSQDGAYLSQQSMYNGHKRKHAVKLQSLTTPDGLIVHLFGPYPDRNHDIKMYHASRLAAAVRADPRFKACRIYGDLAYGQDEVTCCPFGGAVGSMSAENKTVNKSMSKVRVSVEWSYGQICNYWSALDLKRQARTGKTPVAQMYRMGVLFTNCITYSRGGNSISDYFNLQPPSLTTYLNSEAQL